LPCNRILVLISSVEASFQNRDSGDVEPLFSSSRADQCRKRSHGIRPWRCLASSGLS